MRSKLLVAMCLFAAMLALGLHSYSSSRSAKSSEVAPKAAADVPAAVPESTARAENKIPAGLPQTTDEADDLVADVPSEKAGAEVIWEKEQGGWKVMLNSSGAIMLTSKLTPDMEKLQPGEAAQGPIPQNLQKEAREQMKRLLPVKRRSEWEADEKARQAKALAAAPRKPVDPSEYGYADMNAMKAAYRSREKDITPEQDIELIAEKNGPNGEYAVKSYVTQVSKFEQDEGG